jgi:hypothetical protein
MPSATNLVLKDAAAADVTFELLSPAAGDGGIAEWALKEGVISSVFPRVSAQARRTGNSSRKLTLKLKVPSSYMDTVTGLTKVGSAFEFNGDFSVPDDFPEALKDDTVAYTATLVANSLVKAMFRDGLPAT